MIDSHARPLCAAPEIVIGSKPIDGGYYVLSRAERDAIVAADAKTSAFIRPYVGAEEHINGGDRWIVALHKAEPELIAAMPALAEKVRQVRDFRLGKIASRNRPNEPPRPIADGYLADTPTLYHVNVLPDRPFLIVPEVSSENRDYAPLGYASPPVVPSSLVRVAEGADLFHFGVLTSRMHMAWLRHIGGRLKSDYRYSIGIVYNTFPWPEADEKAKDKIRALAQAVLDARAAHPGATLADLYDADLMPADLRKAHRDLDAAVDKLHRAAPFDSDRARVEHLFALYERLAAPLIAASRAKKKRK